MLALALLLLIWVILVHGDLKQRTDGCVAVASSSLLLGIAIVALQVYDPDFRASVDCAIHPTQEACADLSAVIAHNQNAATLQQIWSLMAFGQIIPLLTILKDAAYCWLKPTQWQETSLRSPEYKRIRRENRDRLARSRPEDRA